MKELVGIVITTLLETTTLELIITIEDSSIENEIFPSFFKLIIGALSLDLLPLSVQRSVRGEFILRPSLPIIS